VSKSTKRLPNLAALRSVVPETFPSPTWNHPTLRLKESSIPPAALREKFVESRPGIWAATTRRAIKIPTRSSSLSAQRFLHHPFQTSGNSCRRPLALILEMSSNYHLRKVSKLCSFAKLLIMPTRPTKRARELDIAHLRAPPFPPLLAERLTSPTTTLRPFHSSGSACHRPPRLPPL
jgi:hypothetical protein